MLTGCRKTLVFKLFNLLNDFLNFWIQFLLLKWFQRPHVLARIQELQNGVNCMNDIPRSRSTCVFPTFSRSWRNAKPFCGKHRRPLQKISRGTNIRGRFRSITAHDEQTKDLSSEELETLRRFRNPTVVLTANGEVHTNEEAQVCVHDLDLFVTVQILEDTPTYSQWRSAYKRGSSGICSRSWSLRYGAITRGHACSSVTWNTLRRTRIYLWVGQRQKTTPDQTREEHLMQNGKLRTSCGSWIPLHRHCRTRQVHLQLQHQSEVTKPHQETGAIHHKPKTKKKGWQSRPGRPFARPPEMVRGVHNKISKIQKWLQPDTFLMTQIRNGLWKWHPGSTVSSLSSRKIEIGEVLKRTKMTRAPCRRRTRNSVPRAEKFGDFDNSRSKSLQQGRWISKQSSIRSRGTRSCH